MEIVVTNTKATISASSGLLIMCNLWFVVGNSLPYPAVRMNQLRLTAGRGWINSCMLYLHMQIVAHMPKVMKSVRMLVSK